jgi:hypothetical protein
MGHAVGEMNIESTHKNKSEIINDLKDDETEADTPGFVRFCLI